MKTPKVIITVIAFLFIETFLQAQSIENIFESYWEGTSKDMSDLFDVGYVVVNIAMYDVDYNADTDRFTASMKKV